MISNNLTLYGLFSLIKSLGYVSLMNISETFFLITIALTAIPTGTGMVKTIINRLAPTKQSNGLDMDSNVETNSLQERSDAPKDHEKIDYSMKGRILLGEIAKQE
jgi:hypothetical protein